VGEFLESENWSVLEYMNMEFSMERRKVVEWRRLRPSKSPLYKRRKGGFESPQPPLILSVRIEIFRVGRFESRRVVEWEGLGD
jgi:hypothetical protein